ncbi:MAG: hypothetical protein ACOVJ1_06755, partial [Sediminibacterium sp.]
IMAYERSNGRDKVVVVLNLSNQPQLVMIDGIDASASFQDIFINGKYISIRSLQMPAWGYQVFVKKN